jgi:drug/metabolite transporter (DMT)-like permease
MRTLIAAAAAVGAGLFLAAGGVLQQRAASTRPEGERHFVLHLLRTPIWLAGITAAGASYGLQAVALSFGPLALVQPLVVSELVFALPVSVRLRGLRLRPRDWLAVGAVVAGLALGIVAAEPRRGNPLQPFAVWVLPLIVVGVLAAVGIGAARVLTGPAMATALAASGAVVMAMQSALYNATIALIPRVGFWSVFAHWQPYLLVAMSIAGAVLIQNAFRAGPLAASTPVIDSLLPLGAVALGLIMFGEQVRTSAWALAGAGAGVLLLVAGIVLLDTSPVVRKEQRIERAERQQGPDDG